MNDRLLLMGKLNLVGQSAGGFMIGQLLANRYVIQQQLGKKAGRQTFLAHDLETQALVVIKLLIFNQEFEWDDLKLFEREANLLKNLSHPAIPHYFNYFEVDLPHGKGFALVQNYIKAKSLEEQLKSGRIFSESEVEQLAGSLLEILIYLQSQKPPVIHRDIKPSNILLADRSGNHIGQVYLVDFGAVQTLAAREGGTITVVGTYGYMAPEQFGGRATPASDLYSLGATLIYLITGTHPADLPQKDLRIQFEQFTYFNPTLTNWLKRMIEPSLDNRFTDANEALDALTQPQLIGLNSLSSNKPSSSKIVLNKNREELEIVIPPQGFNLGLIGIGLFATAWNTFLIFWTGMALFIPFPFKLLFLLFSLPFWGAGITMVVGILFSLFGYARLQIDQKDIVLNYELFNFKYANPRPSPREDIVRLERTELSFRRDSDGDRVRVPPALIITAGRHEYKLAFELSELELDWLAYELSDWLGLPVKGKNILRER